MTVGLSKTEMLRPFIRSFRLKSPHYYTVIRSSSSAFQWSQNVWPWVTCKRDSTCFLQALASDTSASTRLPCSSYINVPLSTYCEIRYVSKFTASLQRHRAVLPAIARLSSENLRAIRITNSWRKGRRFRRSSNVGRYWHRQPKCPHLKLHRVHKSRPSSVCMYTPVYTSLQETFRVSACNGKVL